MADVPARLFPVGCGPDRIRRIGRVGSTTAVWISIGLTIRLVNEIGRDTRSYGATALISCKIRILAINPGLGTVFVSSETNMRRGDGETG